MIRPTPASSAPAAARRPSCCCRGSRSAPAGSRPRSGDGELAAGADVEVQPLLGDPARDRGAEERLAGVVDVVAGEGVAEVAARERGSRPRRGRTPGCRCSRRRSATRTPADGEHAVGLARAVRDHRCAHEGVGVGRAHAARPAPGCRHVGVQRSRPRGLARSHPLGGGDAEQVEAVGEHRAGGVDQQQPGPVQVAGLLVAQRQHPAGVVEPVVGAGDAPRGSARPGAARAARRPS